MGRFDEARNVDCKYILSQQGCSGIYDSKGRLWYFSPKRDEGKRSLIVYPDNKWCDLGEFIKPKSSIDLYCWLYDVNPGEAVDSMLGKEYPHIDIKNRYEGKEKASRIEIVLVEELTSTTLTKYILERSIVPELAAKYLRQIHVRFPSGKAPDRTHKVLGLQCDAGGWELRNSYLKVGSSPKSPTTFKKGSDTCVLFEGMFDFLSLLMIKGVAELESDVFIYNSTSFLEASIEPLREYSKVCCFVDNDDSGNEVVRVLKENGVCISDYRHLYKGYNDLNEMLIDKVKL